MAKDGSRRWQQFSIRGALLLVLLIGSALAWLAASQRPFLRQARLAGKIVEGRGTVRTETGVAAWLRWLLGPENCQDIIEVACRGGTIGDEFVEDLAALPRARRFSFDDAQLTTAGFGRLADAKPDVPLYFKTSWSAHPEIVRRLAFSRAGDLLATVGDDAVKVWDVGSGSCVAELKGSGAAACVTFSSDGQQLVVGEIGYRARTWDVRNSTPLGAKQHLSPSFLKPSTGAAIGPHNSAIYLSPVGEVK